MAHAARQPWTVAPSLGMFAAALCAAVWIADGNLGAHIDHLAKASYVAVEKAFVARRPRTTVKASAEGRRAFEKHVAFLRSVIDGGA